MLAAFAFAGADVGVGVFWLVAAGVLALPLVRTSPRKRRLRASSKMTMVAAIPPLMLILDAAGLFDVSLWRPTVGLIGSYIFGVTAWRLHRQGL